MTLSVRPKDLLAALDRVQHAAAVDYARPILCGVLFTGDETGLRLVAGDNYRLAEARVGGVDDATLFGSAVVRIEDIAGIRWLLKGYAKGTIPVELDRGLPRYEGGPASVVLSILGRSLTLEPIDGTYPRYEVVFDQTTAKPDQRSVTLNPAYLRDAGKATNSRRTAGVLVTVAGAMDPVLVSFDGYHEAIMPIRTVDSTPKEQEPAEVTA